MIVQTRECIEIILKHSIMQNTWAPTSKGIIIYRVSKCEKPKVQRLFWNLSYHATVIPYIFVNKKHIIYLEIQKMYFTIPKSHHEEVLELKKTKSSWAIYKHCITKCILQISNSFLLCPLKHNSFSLTGFIPRKCFPEQVSLHSSISKSWGLQKIINIWDAHKITSAPPKRLDQFSISALCITLSSACSGPLYCSCYSCCLSPGRCIMGSSAATRLGQ